MITVDFSVLEPTSEKGETASKKVSETKKQPAPKKVSEAEKPEKKVKTIRMSLDAGRPLTEKQERFCQYFIESKSAAEAAVKAGYSPNCKEFQASSLLNMPNIAARIKYLRDKAAKPHIATGTEVMQFFSDVMTGKLKDQFGLEVSISDRTKAAIELAKRTVDLDQRLAGKPDATVEIKLNWER